ncbi:MAG TPA: CoB--CoM heterodisulfide reductase iron-sulfur subunit B family protein [bacterium]|nr:CoB--CoM heterodisulfide reductase iron-sulfur subunit B family protein [bacterium]
MKYAYYPGCNTEGLSRELDQSMRAIAPKLGIELVDLPEFVCCGAGQIREKDDVAELALNVRNLCIAERQGLDLLTVCATCYGTLLHTQYCLTHDRGRREQVASRISSLGYSLEAALRTRVVHILEVFNGLRTEILKQVISPESQKQIVVAPFYGCRLLRPHHELTTDFAREYMLESLITACGFTSVAYAGRTACCGFDIAFTDQPVTLRLLEKRLAEAAASRADWIVTACPLCQNVLDGLQSKARRGHDTHALIPVLHLPQLVGIVLGIDFRALGLQRHIVPVRKSSA